MHKLKRVVPVIALLMWDFVAAAASVFLGFLLRSPTQGNLEWAIPPVYRQNINIYILTAGAVMIVCNALCGCYSGIWRHTGITDMIRQLLSVVFGVAIFYVSDRTLTFGMPWEVIVIMGLINLFLMGGARISVRLAFTANEKLKSASFFSQDTKRVLIFGAGEAGRYLQKNLNMHKEEKLRPVVFIDDDSSYWNKRIGSCKVFGPLSRMGEAIKEYEIDLVIVAIPTASRALLEQVLKICRDEKCQMRTFGSIDDVSLSTARLAEVDLERLLRRDSVTLDMDAVSSFVDSKVVMVTGGAGSIGSELCRQALFYGCAKLIVFDFNENGLFEIDNELKASYGGRYELALGSVRDRARMHEVMQRYNPQIVFHAAAHKHVPMMEISPCEAIKNNVMGTINLAQVSIENGVEKVILISTDKAVNPTNVMGASKRIAEMSIQMMNDMSKTDLAAVRFGNVLGSQGSVVPFFQKQIAEGGPVTVTHKAMRRYFMTIPEAVQLVLEAGAMAKGGEIFALNMGEPVRIYDLACDLIRLSGYEPNEDIKIEITGLRPGEKLFEEISLEEEYADKTPNSKIFVMKPVGSDPHHLAKSIKELELSTKEERIEDIFRIVKDLVPSFNHQNAYVSRR